jgi:hypothetical protein
MTESLGATRTRGTTRVIGLAIALLVLAFIASAVVSLTADSAPSQTRDPGPAVTYPTGHRGDFHEGYVRRGVITDQGFHRGVVKRG